MGKSEKGETGEIEKVRRVCMCTGALRVKEGRREGEEKACVLFYESAFNFSTKPLSPLRISGLYCQCVCAEHLSSPLSLSGTPSAPLVFCYHKEIGVSIAGRALVAQAPVHCSME